MSTQSPPDRLTAVELELMTIIWRLGEATVRDVIAELPADRSLAYTSVSTILRILEKKGALANSKSGRTHIYKPVIDKSRYEQTTVDQLVTHVFDNTPSQLVRTLLNSRNLSADELQEIRNLVNEMGDNS